MFCEKCGTKNDSTSKFCEKCGEKFEVKSNTKTTINLKEKFSSLDKKQKLIGGIILAIIVIFIGFYSYGSKITSLESLGIKAFEQLAEDSYIDEKYLYSKENSNYFITSKEAIKTAVKNSKLDFDYKNYKVTTGTKSVIVKYKDNTDDETYRVVFKTKTVGKTYLIFDKKVISKITVEKVDGYKTTTLYDPTSYGKITIKAPKGSKIKLNKKNISEYKNAKKSNKTSDVYVIKGTTSGYYTISYEVSGLEFSKKVYSYGSDSSYDLFSYLSSSYLKDNDSLKKFNKPLKKYITAYYENVMNGNEYSSFSKKYKGNDDIKKEYEDSITRKENYSSFEINDAECQSFSFNKTKNTLSVRYKVTYKYVYGSLEERESTDYITVTYNLDDLELPINLESMPL